MTGWLEMPENSKRASIMVQVCEANFPQKLSAPAALLQLFTMRGNRPRQIRPGHLTSSDTANICCVGETECPAKETIFPMCCHFLEKLFLCGHGLSSLRRRRSHYNLIFRLLQYKLTSISQFRLHNYTTTVRKLWFQQLASTSILLLFLFTAALSS